MLSPRNNYQPFLNPLPCVYDINAYILHIAPQSTYSFHRQSEVQLLFLAFMGFVLKKIKKKIERSLYFLFDKTARPRMMAARKENA